MQLAARLRKTRAAQVSVCCRRRFSLPKLSRESLFLFRSDSLSLAHAFDRPFACSAVAVDVSVVSRVQQASGAQPPHKSEQPPSVSNILASGRKNVAQLSSELAY